MNEYLLKFENLKLEMTVFNMKIPDTVLAFQILEGAGLNENQRQMALTLASYLTFKSMKGVLETVFGSENVEKNCNFDNSYLDSQIKQQNVCYTQQPSKQNKGKFNPLTKQGVVSRCTVCDSKMHWAKDCQHKRSETANNAELNNETEDNTENIIEEANNVSFITADTKIQTDLNAIIDTACTKTVAREEWLKNYLKNLDDTLTNQVEVNPRCRIFKFGDHRKVIAISSVKIPAQIGEKNCFIVTEIVKEKIHLLLSKSSLKKVDTVLNTKNDKIKMFGQNIPVESSFNGHYSISILPEITSNFDDIEQVLILTEKETIEEKRKLIKLHKQFGHVSSSNLLNLMKQAGVGKKIFQKLLRKKQNTVASVNYTKNRFPAVSIPRSLNFNEVVAIDLHQLGDHLRYLHFIDEFSQPKDEFFRSSCFFDKAHCSRTQKNCDFSLPSTIDLQSKEINVPSSIEKQVNKSLPIIYDSCDDTDDNNEDSSDNQESHNENDDMKNLHKDNINGVTEQLSNISINDQNVPNIKKGQTVSFYIK